MKRERTGKRPPVRDREVTDMPAIRLREGRFLLGLGNDRWREKWDEVYQYIVLHWETTNCVMMNLESLVVAMYPSLEKNTQARTQFAQDFMWRVIEERRRVMERGRQKKREAENDQFSSQKVGW